MARTDLLTVLEHAYGPAEDDGAWLREIVAAAADAGLDRGLGACGCAAIAARGDLARRARSIDRARGRLRREDPDAALAAWTALHEGRWALVDSFDHNGRRYVLARPVASAAPRSLAVLSDGEREVAVRVARGHADKLIAYELGLAPSTVATRLTSACKKLGVRSRVELVRAVRRAREEAPS
jgi:DNA-binding NarL/FixJ family response regulator